MEIDKTFYHTDNDYNKDIYAEYEQDIENYINQYDIENYNQIIQQDKRTNIVSIFSEMRANIIKWYPFDKSKTVLEVGANYGEITYDLAKLCNKVTAIEFSEKKIKCLAKRLINIENVKLLLCTNIKDLEIEEKYDYITLIGIPEYARKIGFKNLQDMLNWTKEHLKEDGKILLAIDNKFGVKYLAGSTRNKNEEKFANFREHITTDYQLYGKNELENILKSIGDVKYKFYYPVPNYKLTHMIYTDDYLPRNSRYNIYYADYEEILFEELSFLKETIKNNQFDFFTNSYLIEISKKTINNITYVNYSNMRNGKYKIITKISSNQVTKEPYKEDGIEHVQQIQENIERLKELGFVIYEKKLENQIISPYISIPTMDEYLKKLLVDDNQNKFTEELDKWYEYIKSKIPTTEVEETVFEKYNIKVNTEKELTFLQDGFIDLIFQNVFYDGKEYIVFDQEWRDTAVPIEFIMYRSIKQFFFLNKELENKIDKEKIYAKYKIDKYISVFEQLEEAWQKTIVNEETLKFYAEKWSRIISIEDMKFKSNQELGKVYLEKDKLQLEFNKKQEENIKLQNELNSLKNNSRFYRWTRFLKKG